jgi:hypothetical protein
LVFRGKNGTVERQKNGKREQGARRLKCKNGKIETLKNGIAQAKMQKLKDVRMETATKAR